MANEHYRYHCIQTKTVYPLYFITYAQYKNVYNKDYISLKSNFMPHINKLYTWQFLGTSVSMKWEFSQKPNKRNKSCKVFSEIKHMDGWMDRQTDTTFVIICQLYVLYAKTHKNIFQDRQFNNIISNGKIKMVQPIYLHLQQDVCH